MKSLTSSRRGAIAIGVAFIAALAAVALAFVLAPANAADSERSMAPTNRIEERQRTEVPLWTPDAGAKVVAPETDPAPEAKDAPVQTRTSKARPAPVRAPVCDSVRDTVPVRCAPCVYGKNDSTRAGLLPCGPLPKPTCRQDLGGTRMPASCSTPAPPKPPVDPRPIPKPTIWCLDQPQADSVRAPCPNPRGNI